MTEQTPTILKGWKIMMLEDVADVVDSLHITPKYSKNGFPMVRVTDIKSGPLETSKCLKVSKETYLEFSKKHKSKIGDIVFSRVGSEGIASIVKNENPFCLGQNTVFLVPREKNNFLYYWLSSPEGRLEIQSKTTGTTQRTISLENIRKFEISVPSISEQRAIAAVLSSLDDKIELLREQNKTLEATAQAIFKEWFVDFNFPNATGKMIDSELGKIPEGWRVGKLGEETEAILGGTPSTENGEYWENGTVPWINSGKVNEFRICEPTAYITEKALKESAAKIMPKGTVVIAITGATLGQVSRLEIESSGNQSVIGLIANKKNISPYLYYWMLQNIQDIILIATGGAQQHINKNDVNGLYFLIPEESILSKFFDIANPIIEKISGNCFQIQTLSTLRDALLPKLMKGEIRVEGFRD